MVLTHPQAKKALQHILDTVLERGDGTPLKSSLLAEGIEDIFGLVTIDDDTITDLTYTDPDDPKNLVAVQKGDKALLCIFQD